MNLRRWGLIFKMNKFFILYYIHVDVPEYSDVLGVYSTKDRAVKELLERANYREKNGKLTQYNEPTYEYESFDILRKKVEVAMQLIDDDIFIIFIHYIDDLNNP